MIELIHEKSGLQLYVEATIDKDDKTIIKYIEANTGKDKDRKMNRYEKTEGSRFTSKYPCLCLLGVPVEDEEKGNYLLRCFAKEYPEMNLEEFETKFDTVLMRQIYAVEEKFSGLDMEPDGYMFRFLAVDEISLDGLEKCFEALVEAFEK